MGSICIIRIAPIRYKLIDEPLGLFLYTNVVRIFSFSGCSTWVVDTATQNRLDAWNLNIFLIGMCHVRRALSAQNRFDTWNLNIFLIGSGTCIFDLIIDLFFGMVIPKLDCVLLANDPVTPFPSCSEPSSAPIVCISRVLFTVLNVHWVSEFANARPFSCLILELK